MPRIVNLIIKEFGRIKSDRKGLIMLFLFPLITVIIFGFSSGGGYEINYSVGIINVDVGGHGNNMVNAFYQSTSTMNVIYNRTVTFLTFDEAFEDAYQDLKADIIEMIFIIPEEFSQMVDQGLNPQVIVYIDASDSETAENDLYLALAEPFLEFKKIEDNMTGAVLLTPHIEYDVPKGWNEILNYMAAMILPLILIATSMNVSSLSIATESPIARLLQTPASKRDMVLSKFISYSLITTLQVLTIFFTGIAFGLYILGSPLDILIVLLLAGLSGVSLGIFISTCSTSEAQANQLFIAIFIILTLFSGAFIPISDMPPAFAVIANILPLGHLISLYENISFRGFGLEVVNHVVPLLIICGVLLALSLLIFQLRKMEV